MPGVLLRHGLISIHSPTCGATLPTSLKTELVMFQFPPLRVGGTSANRSEVLPSRYFNSRPCMRDDAMMALLFQFTPRE